MAPRAACAALLVLVLGPALLPLAVPAGAQEGTPPPAPAPPPAPPAAPAPLPFEPLPPELRAVAWTFLGDLNRSLAAFRAAHPDQNTSYIEVFREGAIDYLNESRLTLALSQLLQAEVQVRLQSFYPLLAEEERRNASLARVVAEEERSRAAIEALYARLASVDARLRTTHGLEHAVYAAVQAGIGDELVRNAANVTRQLAGAPAAEERIVRVALLVSAGGQLYARWGDALLNLTEALDRETARPPLPAGAREKLGNALRQRLELDPDARSITGQGSAAARDLLAEALAGSTASVQLARFMAFEQARSNDALDFRGSQGNLPASVLAGNLQLVVENASWGPHYDGNLIRTPSTQQSLPSIGYLGLFQADARNHAQYRLRYDTDPEGRPTYSGSSAAWGQLVAARYEAELLQEVPSPRAVAPAATGDWLLYGGIAVVAALAVLAVAFLRRPSA